MKKLSLMIVGLLCLSACGRHLYSTSSGGKENTSYVIVLTADSPYKNVSVLVDEVRFDVEKVYKVKMERKAPRIMIAPGKHNIKVKHNGEVIIDENVFLGLQETKKIVLR